MRVVAASVIAALLLSGLGCGGDDESESGKKKTTTQPPEPTVFVDLVADADRDGLVDPASPGDQDREEEWNAEVGASFIANLDDDDLDLRRDCDDEIVNGDGDLADLATFVVRAWPEAPPDAQGKLALDPESAQSVRIFKKNLDGSWALFLGSFGACTAPTDCTYQVEATISADEIHAGVTFAIEARRFKGQPLASFPTLQGGETDDAKKNLWSGLVDLSFSIDAEGALVTTPENPDGFDRIEMRVAPWVLLGSLGKHDLVWSSKASGAFVKGNTTAAEAAGVAYTPYATGYGTPGGWGDIWAEDFVQTGWTGFPGPDGTTRGIRIANARPWGRTNSLDEAPIKWILGNPDKGRVPGWLGPDKGGAEFYDLELVGSGDTQDSHGNHDVVPPHPGHPLGRIIHGNHVFKSTTEFYANQVVQGPPIVIDTTWLAVEHVDEFFHWVPSNNELGWKLLVASPALMTQMLEDLSAQGHGSAVLHAGKGGTFEMTVDEALANVELNQWSQTAQVKIQGHIDVMKAETGITDADIIEMPTWFEDLASNEKVAWNPGTVNMRMLGDVADIPKPFGPKIGGVDPFEADLKERLGTPASGLGSDGQGLDVYFTDDWYYHEALGEVHCGTNESAAASPNASWWEAVK